MDSAVARGLRSLLGERACHRGRMGLLYREKKHRRWESRQQEFQLIIHQCVENSLLSWCMTRLDTWVENAPCRNCDWSTYFWPRMTLDVAAHIQDWTSQAFASQASYGSGRTTGECLHHPAYGTSLHWLPHLRISWWRHQMETFSALLALCFVWGVHRSPANSPHKGQ